MSTTGTLDDLSLVDIIQMMCMERQCARVQVRSPRGEGVLFFDGGEVIHARAGERWGVDALHEALSWEEGDFRLDKGIRPATRSITGSWTQHVLEGLIQIDAARSRRGPDDPDPPREGAARALPAESWLESLRRLDGVRAVAVVDREGRSSSLPAAELEERDAALSAFLGGTGRRLAQALTLGPLTSVVATWDGLRVMVFDCERDFVGLRLGDGADAGLIGALARPILAAR